MIKIRDMCKNVFIDKNRLIKILVDINLDIADGELVSITGKSGAGKTPLLNMIGLIDRYDSGIYFLMIMKLIIKKYLIIQRNETKNRLCYAEFFTD